MFRIVALALLLSPIAGTAQIAAESSLKFAFYSPSWGGVGGSTLRAGLHLVVDNQTSQSIRLESIQFDADVEGTTALRVPIELAIPPDSLAERALPYSDLLSINQCVKNTLTGNWRLVEVSNYTLNPSVRRLIIEDTSAFRIYQCISTVKTHWTETVSGEQIVTEEWVLYHFESRAEG